MPKRLMILLLSLFAFTLSFPQDSLNIRYVGVWDPLDDFFSVTNIWDFGVYNGYLYVSGSFADIDSEGDTVVYHLVVVDMHNPEDPYVTSGYQIYPMEFYILNGFLYYFKFSSRALVIIDIRDPRGVDTVCVFDELLLNPFGRNIYPFEGDGISYVVVKAYSSEFGRGYYLLDVSDPYSPELLCKFHEFKPDTEWGEDPDWHAIRYGYTVAADYPYVYVGELKEGQGSEWDPYDDTYRHVPVWDSLFIYRYDVRDLSAEPAVYKMEGNCWSMYALDSVIMVSVEDSFGTFVLRSGEDSIFYECYTSAVQGGGILYSSGDTFYNGYTWRLVAIRYAGECGFDTIGSYFAERFMEPATCLSPIMCEGENIYAGILDYSVGYDVIRKILIFQWITDDVAEGNGFEGNESDLSAVVMGDELVFGGDLGSEVLIYDFGGRIVGSVASGKARVNVAEYSSGIYFLRSADGRLNKKVVIIH